MASTIDLSSVNLSIQQFQEIASGKYNAGEVRLTSATTLGKINYHVRQTGKNDVTITHAEVMAIKNAFVKTLSEGGVSDEEINRIRRELGLAPDGMRDQKLHERSIRPLSRQQIREILDRNAKAINARSAGTIRTEAELHVGYSADKMDAIRMKRDAVNASLADSRLLSQSGRISRFQAVVAGDVDFHSEAERKELLDMVQRQKDHILEYSNGCPSNDPNATLLYRPTTDGPTIEMSLGMSEAEYVDKLDDMILRLKAGRGPSEEVCAARREFRDLATPADCAAWLKTQSEALDGAFKVRTAAVTILHDRGVTDHATLSLVNRLSDEDARSLLKVLIRLPKDLRGASVRDNPAVADFVQRANVTVPEADRTFVPALSDLEFNTEIRKLADEEGGKNLPHRFKKVLDPVRREVEARFGKDILPKDVTSSMNWGLIFGEKGGKDAPAITPDDLRKSLQSGAAKIGARSFLESRIAAMLEETGGDPGNAKIFANHYQDLLTSLEAAQSPDAAQAIVDNAAGKIRLHILCQNEQAKFVAQCREMFAHDMGIPLASLAADEAVFTKAYGKALELVNTFVTGKDVPKDEDVRKAFSELARKSVQAVGAQMREADNLGLSGIGKDVLRNFLLKTDIPEDTDLKAIETSSADVRTALEELKRSIDADPLTPKEEILGKMDGIYAMMTEKTAELLPSQVAKESAEQDDSTMRNLLLIMAGDGVPGFTESFEKFVSREDVQGDKNIEESIKHFDILRAPTPKDANTRLAGAIEAGKMPLPYTKALLDAFKEVYNKAKEGAQKAKAEFKLVDFGQGEIMELFSPERAAGQKLVKAVRDSSVAISSTKLKEIAVSILREQIFFLPASIGSRFNPGKDAAERALAKGYAADEIADLEKIATLYQAATLCSVEDAVDAALDPTSDAHRLFSYGGRFTETPSDFKKGLRLIGSFKTWFAETNKQIGLKLVSPDQTQVPEGASPTVVNAAFFSEKASFAYEKFLFEEIARNKSIPLAAEDPEQVFGMGANPATRFVGRGYTESAANTLAQIPPERRQVLYAVVDLLSPLDSTADAARENSLAAINGEIISRVMLNYEEIANAFKGGHLTRGQFLTSYFNDFDDIGKMDNKQIVEYFTKEISPNDASPEHLERARNVKSMMRDTGAKLNEAWSDVILGQSRPLAPYVASVNGSLEELGTAEVGRKAMKEDFVHPEMPRKMQEGNFDAIPQGNNVFTIHISDKEKFVSTQDGSRLDEIEAAIAKFCGGVHPAQLNAVYLALSHWGAEPVNKGLIQHGISSGSHMPLTYTLSKNEETGAITVRYSEPEGLPVHFHWETTIQPDGSSTSTQMVIENIRVDRPAKDAAPGEEPQVIGEEEEAPVELDGEVKPEEEPKPVGEKAEPPKATE